ncbi:TPA: hypothetical protein L6A27_19395 [Pseudomonas aeruginosa]|nr:hypothetical protein AO955_07100 [Pseudomonas aeruginosa]RQB84198.1 hypothetical protein IPC434_21580 [Pseudomonas aeruginosa]HBP6039665.1 hypothetical protein [Pseudomonas aeruginosa]
MSPPRDAAKWGRNQSLRIVFFGGKARGSISIMKAPRLAASSAPGRRARVAATGRGARSVGRWMLAPVDQRAVTDPGERGITQRFAGEKSRVADQYVERMPGAMSQQAGLG